MDVSNSSTKKSEDINVLTDKVVFKGEIFGKNYNYEKNELNNNNNNINKETINKFDINNNNDKNEINNNKYLDNNISFRNKNSCNDFSYFNNKITKILKNHEIKNNKNLQLEEPQPDFKKLFKKSTEKEIEVFESEQYEFSRIESNNNSFSEQNNNNNNNNNNQTEKTQKNNTLKNSDSYSSLNNNLNRNSFDSNSEDQNNGNNKYLNKVICTLSKIENGNATFVSTDDLIFILPSLFIPKDLNIGSTYIFKLYEVNQAENKQERIQLIHSAFAKENIEDENKIEEVNQEFEQTEPDNN